LSLLGASLAVFQAWQDNRLIGLREQRSPDDPKKHPEDLQIPDKALIVRRLDGTIEYWNGAASALYGWDPEEALKKQTHHLLSTRFPQPLEIIEQHLYVHGHWEGDLVHRRRNGAQVVVRSRWELRQAEKDDVSVLEINRLAS
jgi:PAS domain S-box-containing protein